MTVFHRTLTLLLLLLLWYVHSIHMLLQLIKFLWASLIKFNALSSVCIQISMQLDGIHHLLSYGNCDAHKLFGIFSVLKRFQWSHNFKTSVNIQDSPDSSSLKSGFSPKSWIRTSCDIFVKQTSACLPISKERQVKIPPTYPPFMDTAPSCSQARYITVNLHTTYLSHYHAMSMSYADYVKQTKTPPSEVFVVCVH